MLGRISALSKSLTEEHTHVYGESKHLGQWVKRFADFYIQTVHILKIDTVYQGSGT